MAYKVQKFGDHRERRTFSKTTNALELADLLEIQKKSYDQFLTEGIDEVFKDIFPVESFTGKISLSFDSYSFDNPRYGVKESKERMVTYSAPLKVQARVFVHETGEVSVSVGKVFAAHRLFAPLPGTRALCYMHSIFPF